MGKKPESSTDIKARFKHLIFKLKCFYFSGNLGKLGELYGTDKTGDHHYTPHYRHHFKKFRFKKINLLELGVGGYHIPNTGGDSLRMWKRYFPYGRIFSTDMYDKSALEENRIRIFQGKEEDEKFLEQLCEEIGEIDIIIDDGSHMNENVINNFRVLFPKLKDGGIYVVEDTQTSYWEKFGGDSNDLKNPETSMNFFKSLTDSLNHKEFLIPGYQASYFDRKITSMHFYHNLIFIYKGNNDEESNVVVDHEFRPDLKKK